MVRLDVMSNQITTRGGTAMLHFQLAQGGHHQSTTRDAKRQPTLAPERGLDHTAPLHDLQANGRRAQPWAQHHAEGDLLAWAYDANGDASKAGRLRTCAPRLLFERRKDAQGKLLLPNEPGALHLHTAWFCRVRLCPICQWRRSLKVYGQTLQIVQAAQRERPGVGFIHLTLTVRNCRAAALSAVITLLLQSFHRMSRTAPFKAAVLGCMRALEVTHNLEPGDNYDTYHPHLHVLLVVPPSYWHKEYISRARWAEMWQHAARLDYLPQVWVRRIKEATAAGVAELCKYATKPEGYITPSDLDMMQETVAVLDTALHRRRLIAWHGWLKLLHQQLGLDDAEDGDLVHTNAQEEEATAAGLIAYGYSFTAHNYFRERSTADDQERAPSPGGDARIHPEDY